jgi:transposase
VPRPTKLSPEVTEQVTRLLRVGNTVEIAAEAAGISRATFFNWMDRGLLDGSDNEIHRDFRDAVEQARAEAEATLVARIAKAAQNGSWSAAAWLLERRSPENWAKVSERDRRREDADDELQALLAG